MCCLYVLKNECILIQRYDQTSKQIDQQLWKFFHSNSLIYLKAKVAYYLCVVRVSIIPISSSVKVVST